MHRLAWIVIPQVLEGPSANQPVKWFALTGDDPWKKFIPIRPENKKGHAPFYLGPL